MVGGGPFVKWLKRLGGVLLLLSLSCFAAYWSILYIRPYRGITGNLCKVTPESPYGDCYEMLPSGGFPFTFMWDNGGVSVVGSLSWIEDTFVLQPFLMNWAFYFIVFAISIWVLSQQRNKKA